MISIKVCVGSSCHLKGSSKVIQSLQQLIQSSAVEDRVELKVAFWLGRCTEAVSLMLPSDNVRRVLPTQINDIFNLVILPHALKGDSDECH